ncbi:hypothetical protein CDL12_14307 [Handroanthus impetiginosus]|uniref:Uncharacterized protein n=1 Tax=Handroanthus impetiginosus TaxID=429701 RepID=A0A2G9H6D9_9LAMI|nr:hypothetical protein CDL12_14307 [Handroanthus impetiginosus]
MIFKIREHLLVLFIHLLAANATTMTSRLFRIFWIGITGFQQETSKTSSSHCGLICKFVHTSHVFFRLSCPKGTCFVHCWLGCFLWNLSSNHVNSWISFNNGTIEHNGIIDSLGIVVYVCLWWLIFCIF